MSLQFQNNQQLPSVRIRPKLKVNQPGDIFEQEADAMAEMVMRMTDNKTMHQPKPITGLLGRSVQRKCVSCEEEEKKKRIMRKEFGGSGGLSVSSSFASSLNASKGSGSPLSPGTRDFMENAFSTDFSFVRIHADNQASEMSTSINAKAFTDGSDIYFNKEQYNPNSHNGKRLLVHELTHTLQQSNGLAQSTLQRDIDIGNLPIEMYVDRFDDFIYDLDYRHVGGSLSKYLTIRYSDGNVVDINIDSIVDNSDPAQTAEHMRNGYLGDAGRIFPSEMNRFTTPRLYNAKREAINIMGEYNYQFMLTTLPAVIFIISMTAGTGIGSRTTRTPLSRRPIGLLITTGRFSVDAGRTLTTEEWVVARQLVREGRTVRAIAESTAEGVRSADFLVNGVRTELKTVSNITSPDLSGALSRTIRSGAGQGTQIIINGRNQTGLTREVAERAIRRFYGAETMGRVTQVRIIGSDFDITIGRIN